MAQNTKFTTFGGVFTPSILTILGVIMYLRLPWVVGNSGLYAALGIIAVAHVVSVSTGLSISSIATDKKVGAGGPYYIVSRSLGLPIGGTLGLALFLGLSFSISLYVIGFSESFLSYWGIEANVTTIRICGTVTLVLLTIVTLISTALAIKTQYLILGAIALSLLSIFLGSPPAEAAAVAAAPPVLQPAENGASMAVLFGIFFPAVTGFTAGVNMSGDLRDPKKAIPRGTILAILAGLIVYTALAVFLTLRVPREALMNNPEVLLDVALFPPAVVAGIWGATLSSALGSILGAPRILQAMSSDRITPTFFAKGYGAGNEPRNALLVAFAIGEAGVLIAELDAIARIVSIVFLATYGFLNMSCAIESWVSPDFRPAFRIPRMVSVIGAVTCALLMIQLDLLAMAAATAVLGGLFLLLSRKQLTLEAGDAWEGIWSSLVRSGLWRLSRESRQQRNWRPNILAFRPPDADLRARFRSIAKAFIRGKGMLSDIELTDDSSRELPPEEDEVELGMFRERLPAGDVYDTIASTCEHRGFGGLKPNAVLMDWASYRQDPQRFGDLLDVLTQLDQNVLLYAHGDIEAERSPRIDIWWSVGAGNASLSTALIRFITRGGDYDDASLRFLLVSNDTAANDHLRATLRGLLTDARVDATIRIVNNTLRTESLLDHVERESEDAALTIVGLPIDPDQCGPTYQARVDELTKRLGRLLLIRASKSFEEPLRLSRQPTVSFIPIAADGESIELPPLDLPRNAEIVTAAGGLANGYQRLASHLQRGCIQRVYGREIRLVRRIKKVVEKHFAALTKGLPGANPRRARNLINRVQSSLLKDFGELLQDFSEQGIEAQKSSLEERTRSFVETHLVVPKEIDETLMVHRPVEDFAPARADFPTVRSIKRRKRLWAKVTRKALRTKAPIGRLKAYYFERALEELLEPMLKQFVTDSHNSMVHLGKTLTSAQVGLNLARVDELPSEEVLRTLIDTQKRDLIGRLDELVEHNKKCIGRHQWSLLVASRKITQRFVDDLARIDVVPFAQKQRRPHKRQAAARRERLSALPEQWYEHQKLIAERARLGLQLSTFQLRLSSVVERHKQSIELMIQGGALGTGQQVLAELKRIGELLETQGDEEGTKLTLGLDIAADFDRRFDAEHVVQTLVSGTADLAGELPSEVKTLTDESIQHLDEGRGDDIETVEIPVLRLAQFLVEARLVGPVQSVLERVPTIEARALSVAQDALRLVSFQFSELDPIDDEVPASRVAGLRPVVDNGIERLEAELKALAAVSEEVSTTMDDQLAAVIEGTNPYDLSATSADLDQHIRRHHGERAAAEARSLFRRASERVTEALVRLIYRRSAGLLLAREVRKDATATGKLVGRIRALVSAHTPQPEIADALPAYYRQLFYGQASINETFWVGRRRELDAAKRAIVSFGHGAAGAVFIIGERGSGKTSLVQQITTDHLARRPIHRVMAPRGGSVDTAEFDTAFCKAVGTTGRIDKVIERMPDGSVVIIDDLELWWERTAHGMAVIDHIVSFVEKHGHRILFVLAMGAPAFSFVSRFKALDDDALTVLECGPLPAEDLKSIVMLRHGSTGLRFELNGKSEHELTELKLARLFSGHFDYSGGHVGAALRSWVSHVRKVTASTLQVVAADVRQWEIIDELRPTHKALLVQLVLHKTASRERMQRITGMPSGVLAHDVDTLIRMGLVIESGKSALAINPFVHHMVTERLHRKGLLA